MSSQGQLDERRHIFICFWAGETTGVNPSVFAGHLQCSYDWIWPFGFQRLTLVFQALALMEEHVWTRRNLTDVTARLDSKDRTARKRLTSVLRHLVTNRPLVLTRYLRNKPIQAYKYSPPPPGRGTTRLLLLLLLLLLFFGGGGGGGRWCGPLWNSYPIPCVFSLYPFSFQMSYTQTIFACSQLPKNDFRLHKNLRRDFNPGMLEFTKPAAQNP